MDQTNYLVEALFEAIPKSLLLVGRFEYQHTRNISGSESGNANSFVMSGSYYLVPNVRFVAEYSRQKGEDITPPKLTDEEKLQLAVHFGF